MLLFLLSFLVFLLHDGRIYAQAINGEKNSSVVQTWVTRNDPNSGEVLTLLQPSTLQTQEANKLPLTDTDVTITIDPTSHLQQMIGFGAGLPQSSAKVLIDLKQRNSPLYQTVMNSLFAKSSDSSHINQGAALNILRFPIGSCDFSMVNTSYDEMTGDYKLNNFAIDADSENIIEVLLDAIAINPALQVIASPWSAPSWLKTWNSLIAYSEDNTLINTNQVYSTYADYLLKTFDIFLSRGVKIQYFTLQNEPLFGTSNQYPGMYFSSEQALQLAKILAPLLQARGVGILAYDHNWDHPEYPEGLLDTGSDLFAGIAWHCYGGEMINAQEQLHMSHPSKPQFITECTGAYPNDSCDISQGMTGFGWNHEWDMSNILLGATAHYASTGVKWILALDENCGPVLPDVTFRNGRPLVSIPSTASSMEEIRFNQDYWSLAHMSYFISPVTSYRLSSQKTGQAMNNFLGESFYDPVNRMISFIAMNTDHNQEKRIRVAMDGCSSWEDSVPAFGTKIYQWSC